MCKLSGVPFNLSFDRKSFVLLFARSGLREKTETVSLQQPDKKLHILCNDYRFTFEQKMADGTEPTASSCAKALRVFVENGKALLDLAEKESKEGRQHFVETDKCT